VTNDLTCLLVSLCKLLLAEWSSWVLRMKAAAPVQADASRGGSGVAECAAAGLFVMETVAEALFVRRLKTVLRCQKVTASVGS
jgi:hypothetical protein